MKKTIALWCLIFSVGQSFSQDINSSHELGYFFDISQNEIEGIYDNGYQSDKRLTVQFDVGGDRTHGHYYDLQNNKIKGYMLSKADSKYVRFSYKNTSEYNRIKPDECLGYVISKDSFAVIQNFPLKNKIIEKKRFAQVIDEVDDLVFYRYIKFGSNKVTVAFLAKRENSTDYVYLSGRKEDFKKAAIEVFGEAGFLKDKINKNEYTSDDLPQLIKLLKYFKAYKSNKKIHFNAFWDEVDSNNESKYYAVVDTIQSGIYNISYYFKNNTKLYDGQYSSLYPHKKEGIFNWYYSNGILRKTIEYKDDEPKWVKTYFDNGQLHYHYEIEEEEGERVFKKVFSEQGENKLDVKGNGTEVFEDKILNRKIHREFKRLKLVSSHFTDQDGKAIYQYHSENKSGITGLKTLQSNVNYLDSYPKKSVRKFAHGYVLVRCLIDENGKTDKFEIIKGVDENCNAFVTEFLTDKLLGKKKWKTLKIDGIKYAQELVLPFDFTIKSFSHYRNHYYNNNMWWFHHDMMMQQQWHQQQMMQQQMQMNMMRSMPGGF